MFYRNYGKRILDFVIAICALIVLSPLFLIIAIVIKLDSKGSIFFKQQRLGYNGEIFEIYKFRTMVENAESIGDGLSIKDKNDMRITSIGSFLRKSSLDELPQFINILKGEMSLIGPRPPVVYYPYNGFESYPIEYKKRFLIKPGVTGFSQIKVRNSVPWPKRIEYDLEYLEKLSFLQDVKIFFLTIKQVFLRKNIY